MAEGFCLGGDVYYCVEVVGLLAAVVGELQEGGGFSGSADGLEPDYGFFADEV